MAQPEPDKLRHFTVPAGETMSIDEAVAETGLDRHEFYELAHGGRLRVGLEGPDLRVRRAALDAFVSDFRASGGHSM